MQIAHTSGVVKLYGNGESTIRALDGIDLTVDKGEFVAIMGPSGSGKSTLLSVLGGLDTPSLGDVVIDGQHLSTLSEAELAAIRREKVGFVFQSFNLVQILTAEENVALPLLLSGQRGEPVRRRVREVLSLVGLADRLSH